MENTEKEKKKSYKLEKRSSLILKVANLQKTHVEAFNRLGGILDNTPSSSGREMLKKYYQGKFLSRSKAMTAKCCDCSGYYIDGRVDCEVKTCPLYPYMPYGEFAKKYTRPDRTIK